MKPIEQYDRVELIDGRKGIVVEILGDQEIFIVDVGTSPDDWDTVDVLRKDITKVIH